MFGLCAVIFSTREAIFSTYAVIFWRRDVAFRTRDVTIGALWTEEVRSVTMELKSDITQCRVHCMV